MAGKESVTKLANNEEKKKALDAAIAKLEKDFGKGAVMRLGESGAHVAVETVPTGELLQQLSLQLLSTLGSLHHHRENHNYLDWLCCHT